MDIEHFYYLMNEDKHKNEDYSEGFVNGTAWQRKNMWIKPDWALPFDFSNIYDKYVMIRIGDNVYSAKETIQFENDVLVKYFVTKNNTVYNINDIDYWMPLDFEY